MSTVRLVDVEADGCLDALVQLLAALPRPIILVSVVRPYDVLKPLLKKQGADTDGVFFVDATDRPRVEAFGPDVFHVGSPTLLERIGIVCDKVRPRLDGQPHIIIEEFRMLEQYNGGQVTKQFIHSMASQAHRQSCNLDVLSIGVDSDIRAIVDETIRMEAKA